MRLSPRCPPTPSSFGSYERSEATEESDIDILTLTSLVKPDLIRARTKAGLKMRVIDLDRDFVVLNTERFYDVLVSGEPFARNVVEDGIVIYGEFREMRKLPQGDVEIDMQDDAAGGPRRTRSCFAWLRSVLSRQMSPTQFWQTGCTRAWGSSWTMGSEAPPLAWRAPLVQFGAGDWCSDFRALCSARIAPDRSRLSEQMFVLLGMVWDNRISTGGDLLIPREDRK